MNIYNEIKKLEKKGIFICFCYDHYVPGTNCNFSIEFYNRLPADKSIKFVKGRLEYKTGLYGDNNEFGDTADTMVAAIKIAKWLSKGNNLSMYFEDDGPTETVTKKGYNRFIKHLAFQKKFGKMVCRLHSKDYKELVKRTKW